MEANSKRPIDIVLYQPEIPYNTGAIGRTCVALGFKLWLVRPLGFQLTEKAVRRAGDGLLERSRLGSGRQLGAPQGTASESQVLDVYQVRNEAAF